jgi:hypothetical protein
MLTLQAVMAAAGIDPAETLVMRHAYVLVHTDGTPGISADTSDEQVFAYTSNQSVKTTTFPASPPRVWVVFLPEPGGRARFWRVVHNHGEVGRDDKSRDFDLEIVDTMSDLCGDS